MAKDTFRPTAESAPLDSIPVSFPATNLPIPQSTDINSVGQELVDKLAKVFEGKDDDLNNLFLDGAVWRDQLAFTASIRSIHGIPNISKAVQTLAPHAKPHSFRLQDAPGKIVEFSEKTHWLDTGFVFEIEEPKASCMGSFRAVRVAEDKWKLWTVYTVIFALDGVETLDEQKMKEKPIANGAPDGNFPEQTDILVIGAGQSGLCLSALLKSFQIPHVVVDGNQKCGDSWGTRYEACKLHTPKKIGHMPFLRYPENYPVFITAQQLSDHYESYRKSLGLPVYMQSRWEEGKWDEDRKEWTNKIKRKDGVKTIVAKHIVMCTGVGNTDPYEPEIPEREKFKGDIVHSVKYWNAEPWKGKRGLIIGAANSAHDIAMDMVRFGLSSVVLYQRNTSCMITCEEAIGKHYEHYNDFTPIEISDQMSESLPPSIGRILLNGWIKFSAEQNKEFYDSMKAKGMMIAEEKDFWNCIYVKHAGHLIDCGMADMVLDGRVTIRSKKQIVRYTDKGVEYSDGTVDEADVIVMATGFQDNDQRETASKYIGIEEANKMEDVQGIYSEGEQKGVAVQSGHPGFWFLQTQQPSSRHLSKLVALQLKLSLDGKLKSPYKGPAV